MFEVVITLKTPIASRQPGVVGVHESIPRALCFDQRTGTEGRRASPNHHIAYVLDSWILIFDWIPYVDGTSYSARGDKLEIALTFELDAGPRWTCRPTRMFFSKF